MGVRNQVPYAQTQLSVQIVLVKVLTVVGKVTLAEYNTSHNGYLDMMQC